MTVRVLLAGKFGLGSFEAKKCNTPRRSARFSENFKSIFSATFRWKVNIMSIVKDSERKNAFSHRLKDKRKRPRTIPPRLQPIK